MEITVETNVKALADKVWKCFTEPAHITKWNNASADWHCPAAENNLTVNGKFKFTMAAKDGSVSFDFSGVYTAVELHKLIEYTMDDGRKAKIIFTANGDEIKISETFEAENENPPEMQKQGWQAILNNFKKYCETLK